MKQKAVFYHFLRAYVKVLKTYFFESWEYDFNVTFKHVFMWKKGYTVEYGKLDVQLRTYYRLKLIVSEACTIVKMDDIDKHISGKFLKSTL